MPQPKTKPAAYAAPRLKVFGSVRNLTGGSSPSGEGDGQLGMSMSMVMI